MQADPRPRDDSAPAASSYTDFAPCCGAMLLAMVVCALLARTHIDAGAFGMFGFAAIGAAYAFVRRPGRPAQGALIERLKQRNRELERTLRENGEADVVGGRLSCGTGAVRA